MTKLAEGETNMITLADCSCPICLSILIEPVTMPCNHVLCLPCFKLNVDQSSLTCCFCRARISTWCRKATIEKTLINQKLWDFIRERFKESVEARLAGNDHTDADDLFPCRPMHQFAETGEVKKEFQNWLEEEVKQEEKKKKEEVKKSAELILQLEGLTSSSRTGTSTIGLEKLLSDGPSSLSCTSPRSSIENESQIPVFDSQCPNDEPHLNLTPPISRASSSSLKDLELDILAPSVIKKQRLAEQQIKQQKADQALARKLQAELNREYRMVDRRKGTADHYNLRGIAKGQPKNLVIPSAVQRSRLSSGSIDKTRIMKRR